MQKHGQAELVRATLYGMTALYQHDKSQIMDLPEVTIQRS